MRRFISLLVAAAAAAGCATPGDEIRAHTYPAGFEYITRKDVKTVMAELARVAGELDATLSTSAPVDPARVLLILDQLDRAADSIDAGGVSTNHPMLGANMARFRFNLQSARAGAAAAPPNYYLAGSVIGSCRYCHQ